MIPEDQLVEVAALYPGAVTATESGRTYIYIPGVKLPEGIAPPSADLLLCPEALDGYASRLFFGAPISGAEHRNWNAKDRRILDRSWWGFSWQSPSGLRSAQMVAAFLGALKQG